MARKSIGGVYTSLRRSLLPLDHEDHQTLTLETLKDIVSKPPRERTPGNIQALMHFTANIKFFKDLGDNQSSNAHFQCCQHMKYEFFPAQEVGFT